MNIVEPDYGYGNVEESAPDSATRYDRLPQYDKMTSSPSEKIHRRSSLKRKGAPRRSSISYSGEIEIDIKQQNGEKLPVKRRTSITFEEKNQVLEVPSLSSLTNEPEKLWFQEDEYDLIQQKVNILTKVAATGNFKALQDANLDIRGLESRVDCDNVYEEQFFAWKAVFLEQYIQRNNGTFDEELVSKMYHLASMQSQVRAQHRGLQDNAEIEAYTRSTRQMMRRCSM